MHIDAYPRLTPDDWDDVDLLLSCEWSFSLRTCESRYESTCFNTNQMLHSKHSKTLMLLFLPMTQQHIHQTSLDTQIWPLNAFDTFQSVFSPSPKFSPSKLLVGSLLFRDPLPNICDVKELEPHWHLFALSLIMFCKTSQELFLKYFCGSVSVSIGFGLGTNNKNMLSFRGERYTSILYDGCEKNQHIKKDQRKTSPYTQDIKNLARDGHSSSQPPWFPSRIRWVCSISRTFRPSFQKSVQQKVFFHVCGYWLQHHAESLRFALIPWYITIVIH